MRLINKNIIWSVVILIATCVSTTFLIINYTTCLQAYIILFGLSVIFAICQLLCTRFKNIKLPSKIKLIYEQNTNKKDNRFVLIFSAIMTVIATFANYESFTNTQNSLLLNIVFAAVVVFGFLLSWIFAISFLLRCSKIGRSSSNIASKKQLRKCFFGSWAIIAGIYWLHLYLTQLPGIMNLDCVYQLSEFVTGHFSSLYAFTHTMLIGLFFFIGTIIFSGSDLFVTLFITVQIILLACTFAYIIRTIAEIGVSKFVLIIIIVWFCLLPCNIFLSATMFSDMYFSMSVIVFTITCFRLFKEYTKPNWKNILLLTISTLGIGLFRSNGIYILFFIVIALFILFWKSIKENNFVVRKILSLVGLSSICAFLFLGPVMVVLNVEPIDIINKIAIPGQQVARVICECDDVDQHQKDMVYEVLNKDELKEWFDTHNFDPLKFHIRENGNQNFISNNMGDFIKLYINLGMKYPDKYIAAFIDSTSDYWAPHINSMLFVDPNFAFLEQTYERNVISQPIRDCFYGYMQFFDDYLPALQSIGVYVWIFLLCFGLIVYSKNNSLIYCCLPTLFTILIIVLATPIVNEIRYVYPVFCLSPFFLIVSLKSKILSRVNG